MTDLTLYFLIAGLYIMFVAGYFVGIQEGVSKERKRQFKQDIADILGADK